MRDPVFYVCKYTPVELLAGFGLTAERLDPTPVSFPCADSCAHPNLCGYGKAVIEEVMTKGIRRLLLVDCCDVCRRIYDVLERQGNMEFLFLLALPHKDGPAEQKLFARELARLSDALARLSGTAFSAAEAARVWEEGRRHASEARPAPPYIAVTGAHGGAALLESVQERSALPVLDATCTGNRLLAPPPAETDEFLPAYARALLTQRPACMRMQFRAEESDPGALGIICHTVKFCDYYSFQYRDLRGGAKVPLLKIETDCTPQSRGQLATRVEAFSEILGMKQVPAMTEKQNSKYVAGVDSGSSSTDAVILDRDGRIVGAAVLPTGAGAASGAEKALEAALQKAGLQRSEIGIVVTTGYGRDHVGHGDASVTEITCHARGAHHLCPEARTIIDIGGQDSKVIRIDEAGNVLNFVMNDKCAAGTGRFLEMMARVLELSMPEMSALGAEWKQQVNISSMCTVFAESEVVSLIADNTAPADIVHGLNCSVANKTAALVKRLGGEERYIMTGGVALNQGVVAALEEKLGTKIFVSPEAQLCGAIGAARIALESIRGA